MQSSNSSSSQTSKQILNSSLRIYDQNEENTAVKHILDTPINLLQSYLFDTTSGNDLREKVNQLATFLKPSQTVPSCIRDAVTKEEDPDFSEAWNFILDVYAQLKQFAGDDLLMHSIVPTVQSLLTENEKQLLFENKQFTIGFTSQNAFLLQKLIGDKSKILKKNLQAQIDEKLRGLYLPQYISFLQLNLWTHYELELNLLMKPLFVIFSPQRVRDLLDKEELNDPFDKNTLPSEKKKIFEDFQTKIIQIQNQDIHYSGSQQATSIKRYFNEFSIPFFCLKLQPVNSQLKVQFDDEKLKNYLTRMSNSPKAHAVTFRVICEFLKIAATHDGFLNNISYETYNKLLKDPKVKSFLPNASDQNEFLVEMGVQTYKLGILNDQISESEAIASVHQLIYVCQMDDSSNFNYFETIEIHAIQALNTVYHFVKSIIKSYFNLQKGLEWRLMEVVIDAFTPNDITRDALYSFINGMISIYYKCQTSQFPEVKQKTAEIGQLVALVINVFSLFSKIITSLPEILSTEIDWINVIQGFIGCLEAIKNDSIYARIACDILEETKMTVDTKAKQEQIIVAAILSPALGSFAKNIDVFSQTVYAGVSFRLGMDASLKKFDSIEASASTYMNISESVGLDIPQDKGMTPGKWVLFALFPIPFLIGSAVAGSLPDSVTKFYQYALEQQPDLYLVKK